MQASVIGHLPAVAGLTSIQINKENEATGMIPYIHIKNNLKPNTPHSRLQQHSNYRSRTENFY